jgi:hypothetical protein
LNLPVLKTHVELGGSTAKRWMSCPGSVRMSRGRPNYATDHSKAGTAAHAVGELSLRNNLDPEGFDGTTVEGVLVDADMVAAVKVYVDYCRELMQEPGAEWWIEKRVSLAALNPPDDMEGTTDFGIYKPQLRELEIVDFKNGSGVVVEAVDNPQLIYYAIGLILALGAGYQIDTVKMTIVQPRAPHHEGVVRSATMDYNDVLAFAGELLNAARMTQAPDAPLIPGSHCRFCPASAVCPAQADHAQALAQTAFVDLPVSAPPAPETLPPEILGEILTGIPVLKDWIAAVEAHAARELEAGNPVPGRKLVEGKKGNRRWKDPKEVEDWYLRNIGGSEDELYVRTLKSPAQVEKLVGKKNLPAELVEQPAGRPIMVADDDPRPALELSPGQTFLALPSGEE